MFYKYCGLAGKIVPSSQLTAYQPQGLTPYSGRVTQVVFDSVRTQPVKEPEVTLRGSAPVRGAATAPAPPPPGVKVPTSGSVYRGLVPATASYRKIMEMQNLMTREDGKLVWQKFGRDRIGYIASLALSVVGTVMCFHLLYQMSFPKKKE